MSHMLCGVPRFATWWGLTLAGMAFAFWVGWTIGRPGGI